MFVRGKVFGNKGFFKTLENPKMNKNKQNNNNNNNTKLSHTTYIIIKRNKKAANKVISYLD